MGGPDDFRAEYEALRKHFREMNREQIRSGAWLVWLIQQVLAEYSKTVDANYIQRKYPGAGAVNQSKMAIKFASKYASVAGGVSAAAITALELSIPATGGADALVAVPAIGTAIAADVALSTRIQLRATYDLSVIHRAPLSVDDADDALFILFTALGVNLGEKAGEIAKNVGPKVVAYNVRKLLQTGLRASLVELLKKVGGVQLAKKLTERAMMRLLVPGLSIAISAGANYLFTRSLLRTADDHMVRRGALVEPLLRLYRHIPQDDPTFAVKALIVVMEAACRENGWDEWQLHALRCIQGIVCLDDEAIRELDSWFDRRPQDFAMSTQSLSDEGRRALLDLLVAAAALGAPEHDATYSQAIGTVGHCEAGDVPSIATRRRAIRAG